MCELIVIDCSTLQPRWPAIVRINNWFSAPLLQCIALLSSKSPVHWVTGFLRALLSAVVYQVMDVQGDLERLIVTLGGRHVTMQHPIAAVVGAIELWLLEHTEYNENKIAFAARLLQPHMLQHLPACKHVWDATPGTPREGNQLAALWEHYVCKRLGLPE